MTCWTKRHEGRCLCDGITSLLGGNVDLLKIQEGHEPGKCYMLWKWKLENQLDWGLKISTRNPEKKMEMNSFRVWHMWRTVGRQSLEAAKLRDLGWLHGSSHRYNRQVRKAKMECFGGSHPFGQWDTGFVVFVVVFYSVKAGLMGVIGIECSQTSLDYSRKWNSQLCSYSSLLEGFALICYHETFGDVWSVFRLSWFGVCRTYWIPVLYQKRTHNSDPGQCWCCWGWELCLQQLLLTSP